MLTAKFMGTRFVLIQLWERVRPNKWAATALLARAYLYMGKSSRPKRSRRWSLIHRFIKLNHGWIRIPEKITPEAIWQLQPVNAGWEYGDAGL